MSDVAVGSRWKDKDPRYTRRVVEIVGSCAHVRGRGAVGLCHHRARVVEHEQSPRAIGKQVEIAVGTLSKRFAPEQSP